MLDITATDHVSKFSLFFPLHFQGCLQMACHELIPISINNSGSLKEIYCLCLIHFGETDKMSSSERFQLSYMSIHLYFYFIFANHQINILGHWRMA